jgi:hypothetical protein
MAGNWFITETMKLPTQRLVIWMALFAVCLLPMGASAQMFQGERQQIQRHYRFGIIGQVLGSQDFITLVTVTTDAGVFVTNVETSELGLFVVDLKPGNYVLSAVGLPKPTPGGAYPNFVIEGPSQSVTVSKRQFTIVQLTLFSRLPLQ